MRRGSVVPGNPAIGRAHNVDRLRTAGIGDSSPDDRRVRRVECNIEHLVVESYSEIQHSPAQTFIGTLSDTILRANVGRPIWSEFNVKDTDTGKSRYFRPCVTSISGAIERTSKAATRCDTSQNDGGVRSRHGNIGNIAARRAKRNPNAASSGPLTAPLCVYQRLRLATIGAISFVAQKSAVGSLHQSRRR